MLRVRRCTPLAQSRPGVSASPVDELREADARCAFACEEAAEEYRGWSAPAEHARICETASARVLLRQPDCLFAWKPIHRCAVETPAGSATDTRSIKTTTRARTQTRTHARTHVRTHVRTCARSHMHNHVAPRVSNVDSARVRKRDAAGQQLLPHTQAWA